MFEGRDFDQERKQTKERVEQLQNRPGVSNFARKGNYVLQ